MQGTWELWEWGGCNRLKKLDQKGFEGEERYDCLRTCSGILIRNRCGVGVVGE